ncbi:Disintegrin and metalloproteinase domain-containing protein B [Pseudocercospora fuligena]|uniref:Disintegrin and metalloproteinase domain-containing protein B n=1 Tax=Pseudocercospora fuligena TaxID=685502 RepID=A0A8H6RS84_9PEZI|nr:Disintegrin and metalloproteinase domain-containing protein B [Pseudocercospora fuligena]
MRCLLPGPILGLVFSIPLLSSIVEASSTIRNPIGALSTVQNATIHTHNARLTALSEFDLTFNIRDEVYVKFHLEPNHDILAHDANVQYLNPDGSIRHTESVDRLRHKVYKGTAWAQRPAVGQNKWQQVGWARVSVLKDGKHPLFAAAFRMNHDHHHIQTSAEYMRTRHRLDPEIDDSEDYMVLWRDSDILPDTLEHQELKKRLASAAICQADKLSFNAQPEHPVYMAMKSKRSTSSYGIMDFSNVFSKRQIDGTTGGNSAGVNLASTVGQTQGCPSTRKVALVGVATDCTYTAQFNDEQAARENVITQMNQASGVWEGAFNISLGLQNLTISDRNCPGTPAAATEWNQACSGNVDIQDRLNMFSAWRGNQRDANSHWTLLSTCNTESAVGLAWLGQACVGTSITTNGSVTGNGQSDGGQETVTGANVVIRTQGAQEWQIIAHETGHTFGAVHDCTSSACQNSNFVNSQQCCPLNANTCDAGERYIMNPSTSQGITDFSPCSIGNICSALDRNSVNGQCLVDNRGVTTISGQQCGNGIVEQGEDCDCGGEEGCGNDSCCNPTTCKFTEGSVCDDSNEDCCRNCQFASAGTVCRASTGDCDPQETCQGNSSSCPTDQTRPDGTDCGDGLQCASGQCTSRDQQCKSVMGSYTQGNDTYACDSSGCAISCASPEFGTGVCYGLQQNFLDGTTCGGGGRCQNGQCRGASVGGQVKSWIDDHKALVIGICSAVGGLLLFAILTCLFRCCRRGRTRKHTPSPPPGGWQGWNGGNRGGPAMSQQGGYYGPPSYPSQGWAQQNRGNQAWSSPPVPPPVYQRSSSVRYA